MILFPVVPHICFGPASYDVLIAVAGGLCSWHVTPVVQLCSLVMSDALCITSLFIFIPGISLSVFPLWFCLHSQSAMNKSSPGL